MPNAAARAMAERASLSAGDLTERSCPSCGGLTLRGQVDGLQVILSRWPVANEDAPLLWRYGVFLVAARRLHNGTVIAQCWRPSLGPEWAALKNHVCAVERGNTKGWK